MNMLINLRFLFEFFFKASLTIAFWTLKPLNKKQLVTKTLLLKGTICFIWAQWLQSSQNLSCTLQVDKIHRGTAEVKQCWSGMRWVTKHLLSWAPPCFGRYVKPMVSPGFVVISNQSALSPRGEFWPILLMCNQQEDLCPIINRLMMMMTIWVPWQY
jgi:hypothetical protein